MFVNSIQRQVIRSETKVAPNPILNGNYVYFGNRQIQECLQSVVYCRDACLVLGLSITIFV